MSIFLHSNVLESVSVPSGTKVNDFLADRNDLPEHTKALTLKADGVVLGPRSTIPKDALTLELIEVHDPEVVNDDNASETVQSPSVSEPSSDKG